MSIKIVAALCLLSSSVFAASPSKGDAKKDVLNLNQGSGSVEFKAIGRPSALKITGKGESPKGSIVVEGGSVSGAATFDLRTLNTGISMRDEHMKDKYLEVGKYPEAKLTVTKVGLPKEGVPQGTKLDEVPFEGKLLLHGVEKSISGKATVEAAASKSTVTAGFSIKLTDYNIQIPSFAGITVADEVQVTVMSSSPVSH